LPVVAVLDGRTGEAIVSSVGLSWVPSFLTFSPDGTKVAMADSSGRVGLVDLVSGAESWPSQELARARRPAWKADSSTFVVGGERPLIVVDAATGTILRHITTGSGGSLDNGYIGDTDLLATSPGSELVILNASEESGEALVDFESPFGRTLALRVSEDGDRLVLRQTDGYGFATIDATSGAVTQIVTGQDASLVSNESGIAVLSSTGEFAAAIDTDFRYRIWPTAGGASLYTAPEGWVIIGVNVDASLAVINSDNESDARLVSVADDRVIAELDVGPRVFSNAEFSPDSRHVITHADLPSDGLRVWDTSDGQLVAVFGGEGNQFAGLWTRFVPSGNELVNTTAWGDVFIYDFTAILAGAASEDAIIRVIPAHDNFVHEPAISPDGLLLATSTTNEPTRLWEISTGRLLGEFGSGQVPGAPAFHPFEPWLFLVDDIRVRAHTLDVAELIMIATSRLTREMTDEECLRYLHEPCSG
jgi:WD40 repeat protein